MYQLWFTFQLNNLNINFIIRLSANKISLSATRTSGLINGQFSFKNACYMIAMTATITNIVDISRY
jgi:hypothetical protein